MADVCGRAGSGTRPLGAGLDRPPLLQPVDAGLRGGGFDAELASDFGGSEPRYQSSMKRASSSRGIAMPHSPRRRIDVGPYPA